MMESVNMVVGNTPETREESIEEDDEVGIINAKSTMAPVRQDVTTCAPTSESQPATDEIVDISTPAQNKGPTIRIQKIHPQDNIIGSPSEGVMTRSRKLIANACFISKVEPKNIKEALLDEY